MPSNRTRRGFVRGVAVAGAAGALAGCTGNGDDDPDDNGDSGGNTVLVGPGSGFSFDPEELTVSVGETVTWEFESPGHNVSADPDHSDEVDLPDGADPFTSYEGDDQFDTESEGETFEHTFDVAGTYQYVCIPHAAQGMIGRVVVEE